ncbi:MAG: hypothetical protein J5997_13605 [Oscillospiraceae bacterium]|nr:hypothetical protein [Oscillospiraceae bacterium]
MGFKFNDKVCVIDINDVKYSVTFQKALVDRLNEAKGIFTAMKDSGDKEDISKVCGVFDRAIDSILGVGAASAIFAGRFESIAERYAVLKYIYDELTAFFNDISEGKNVQSEAENHHN